MKLKDVDKDLKAQGAYCQKGVPDCFCKVGWPIELRCPDCRDIRNGDTTSYCVCPPDEIDDPVLEEITNWLYASKKES